MELPFKYIVLCIIRTLNERNMPLVVQRSDLVNYITRFMEKSYFTIEEKKQISDEFDFDYELDSLVSKYFQYFDIEGKEISFDSDSISDLGDLILEEMEEVDDLLINDVDMVIEGDVEFLDILGVKVRKELYNYLAEIEKEIEECYNELARLDVYVGLDEVDTNPLINKIKKLMMKKTILLLNTSNLLPKVEHNDLMNYANNIADKVNENEVIELLLDDYDFNEIEITDDVFLRCLFVGEDAYTSNISESIILNNLGIRNNKKYSTIKYYLTFMELLEREINNSNELLCIELIQIKYKLMNVLDSVYGTTLFIGNYSLCDKNFDEDYKFIVNTVCYFINELLMYDDECYRNKETDTDNIMIYLNNILKKLLIETYYKLTNDKKIINMIKENNLYDVNAISTGFLKGIVEKPKTKVKEV